MAHLLKEGFLSVKWIPRLETLRFRRVNIQRPRPPHYERAKYEALIKPIYKIEESEYLPPSLKCAKIQHPKKIRDRPDNPLERILARELFERFEKTKAIYFLHRNLLSGEDEFQARVLLHREKMKIEVHSKHTLAIAFKNTRYEDMMPLFCTHSCIIFAEETNIDKLFSILKKVPQFVLLAGIVDNKLLSVTGLKKLSEIKDITTARSQLVGVLNSCAQLTVSQLMVHPQRLIAQLQLHANSESKDS